MTGRRGSWGGGAVPASVARSPSPRALCATQRRLGMGPEAGLGSAPRNNRSRAQYEVRCGRVRSSPSAEVPSPLAGRRAEGPTGACVRGRGRWRDRDAKTEGRLLVIRERPLRGTPGDRQSPEISIRRSRGVPRPPRGSCAACGLRSQPADRPAVLRAFSAAGGIVFGAALFDRSGRRARRSLRPLPSSSR